MNRTVDKEQREPLSAPSQGYSDHSDLPELDPANPELLPKRVRAALYMAHLLQSFGERLWNFAVPILFMSIWTDTLFPSALFSFVLSGGSFLLMGRAGAWMDRANRWVVMRRSVGVHNALIVGNGLVLLAIVALQRSRGHLEPALKPEWSWQLVLLFVLLLLSALAAQIFGDLALLALERDWVVCIAKPANLSRYNSTLRRIDLLCKFVAPVLFGALVELTPQAREAYGEVWVGVLGVVIWNVAMLPPQFFCLRYLYRSFPQLANKAPLSIKLDVQGATQGRSRIASMCSHWLTYLRHPIFCASLGYCCLYFTVLDNGTLMTAYLKWVGVPEVLLGLSRGVGALFGIVGTFLATCLRRHFSLEGFGVFSVWTFLFCITWAALPYLLRIIGLDIPLIQAGYVMLVAVALSRMALWSFDLVHTEVVQLAVEDNVRGLINAQQTACYQLLYCVLYTLCMVFDDPQDFYILTFSSVGSVLMAAVLWTLWARRERRKGESFYLAEEELTDQDKDGELYQGAEQSDSSQQTDTR